MSSIMSLAPSSSLDLSRESSTRRSSLFRRSGGGEGVDDNSNSSNLNRPSSIANLDSNNNVSTRTSSDPKARRYIRHMASLVQDPIELDLDERRLQNSVREAGEHSLGVDAITVFCLDEDTGRLVHSKGGWWRSSNMESTAENSHQQKEALARLEDSTREDYVPPNPVIPGTDIAGILWAESRGGGFGERIRSVGVGSSRGLSKFGPRRHFSTLNSFNSNDSSKPMENQQNDVSTSLNYQPIRWRDIKSISQDPDSAKGPRLALMEKAGFTLAAGVSFQYHHHQGIVIFLTTVEDLYVDRLACVANSAYLHQSAQFIGAALSLAEIRRATLAEKYKLKEKCYSMHECNLAIAEEDETGIDTNTQSAGRNGHLPHRLVAYSNKLRGESMQIPPSLSWTQTFWTVFGSFVGLLVLSSLNEYYKLLSNEEYFLLIGPFGAMCTLMYGLSAAPASQPRNAVMGQAVAGAISLAFTYIPESSLPVWLRTAIGPAFAIGAMVKLGIAHPPAGAHSVLYASGRYNFGFYGLVVISTAISVIPATMINNMSSKRQYPTYWGVGETFSWLYSWVGDVINTFNKRVKKHNLPTDENLASLGKKTVDLMEADDTNKRSNQKAQPNRLVIHEECDGDDDSSCGNAPAKPITE